jgi:hypothetical protein
MESLKETYYLTDDVLFPNGYNDYYNNFPSEIILKIILESEYLDILQEKSKGMDFYIGV